MRVYQSETGNVEVKVWGSDVAPNVTFSGDGDSLVAEIRLDTLAASEGGQTAVGIYLPAGPRYNVTLRNGNGNVAIAHEAGLNGTGLDVQASHGDIVLIHNGFEQINLNASGQIAAVFSGGNARYHSSKNSVSLGIASSSGSARAEAPEGLIDVLILPGTNFTLNATSDTGSISCSIPLNFTVKEKGRLSGDSGVGAAVDLSARGDITVRELQPQ